jgi:hypothetical protein
MSADIQHLKFQRLLPIQPDKNSTIHWDNSIQFHLTRRKSQFSPKNSNNVTKNNIQTLADKNKENIEILRDYIVKNKDRSLEPANSEERKFQKIRKKHKFDQKINELFKDQDTSNNDKDSYMEILEHHKTLRENGLKAFGEYRVQILQEADSSVHDAFRLVDPKKDKSLDGLFNGRRSVAYEPYKKGGLHQKSDSFGSPRDYLSAENLLTSSPKAEKVAKNPKIPRPGQLINNSTRNIANDRTGIPKIGPFYNENSDRGFKQIHSEPEESQREHQFVSERILPNKYSSESQRGIVNTDNSSDVMIGDGGLRYKFVVSQKKENSGAER